MDLQACMYVCLRPPSMHVCMSGASRSLEVSDIHTYMLGGPCLDRPPEAQKIKFRTGSPECFKTIAETKVWTHFLVQAGYLDFWAEYTSMITPCPSSRLTRHYVSPVITRCGHARIFRINPYMHTCSPDIGSSQNQVSTRLSRMPQNIDRN